MRTRGIEHFAFSPRIATVGGLVGTPAETPIAARANTDATNPVAHPGCLAVDRKAVAGPILLSPVFASILLIPRERETIGREKEDAIGIQVQNNAELIYGVTFAVIFGISVVVVFGLYRLGSLPGRVARALGHPRATAITVCGWLGLLVFVLWPIAFLWAHKPPKKPPLRSLTDEDLADLAIGLQEVSEQIATLEARIEVHSRKEAA